jgi:predicted PurR-regulated permease PerM
MGSHSGENSSNLPSLVAAVVGVAALYFGREVLVPITVAILLTVLLSPIASRLEKHHFGKSLSALTVWFAAMILIAFVGWLVVNQGIRMVTQIPTYSATISKKIQSIQGAKNSSLGKAAASIRQLGQQLSNAIESTSSEAKQQQSSSATITKNNSQQSKQSTPVPVEVVGEHNNNSGLKVLGSTITPVLVPLVKIGIVFVVAIFMLLRREDIQERLFTLGGLNRIRMTKQAVNEATNRVIRYLWLLSSVNFSFGALFGVGLYFLGLPNALLWGVLAGLLRFIPYVGSAVGAGMPILFAFAVFTGWTKPLIALGIYLFLEGIAGYAVEPFLYSKRTGISPLAILVAAIFWAALWGPIGLLLSTPLTLCIVSMARYIPQLEFLGVLLGDRTVGTTDVQLYLALTSADTAAAEQAIDDYVKERSIQDLYDSVFMPVLILAGKDQADEPYAGRRKRQLFGRLRLIVEELTLRYPKEQAMSDHSPDLGSNDQVLPYRHAGTPHLSVSCVPMRDEGDEITCVMLAHLLTRAGYDAHEIELGPARVMGDEIADHNGNNGDIICISVLPPFGVSSIRRLYKRIQSRFPKCRVAVCLWTYSGDMESMKALLKLSDSDLLITTLSEVPLQLQQLVEPTEREREKHHSRRGPAR